MYPYKKTRQGEGVTMSEIQMDWIDMLEVEKMAKLEYTRERVYELIRNYDHLHDLKLVGADNEPVYQVNKLVSVHQTAPYETMAQIKNDLINAILKLSAKEKFILLATCYEGLEGVNYFCDWLAISPESMKTLRDEVLNKIVSFMNPEVEKRGGSHGGGRRKESKL